MFGKYGYGWDRNI